MRTLPGRGRPAPPRRPARRSAPRPVAWALAAALTAVLATTACAANRPLATAIVPAVEFEGDAPAIGSPIELCLSPALRQRQWNAERHPFRVELGPRAALVFERLAKTRFRSVEVTFDRDCGAQTGLPVLEARIPGAHREPYEDVVDPLQYTAVELETTLRTRSGEVLWQTREDGVVGRPLPLDGNAFFDGWSKGSVIFFPIDLLAAIEERQRLEQARVDFGDALVAAFEATDAALRRDADEIRLRLRSANPDRTGASETFAPADEERSDADAPDPTGPPIFQLAPLTDD